MNIRDEFKIIKTPTKTEPHFVVTMKQDTNDADYVGVKFEVKETVWNKAPEVFFDVLAYYAQFGKIDDVIYPIVRYLDWTMIDGRYLPTLLVHDESGSYPAHSVIDFQISYIDDKGLGWPVKPYTSFVSREKAEEKLMEDFNKLLSQEVEIKGEESDDYHCEDCTFYTECPFGCGKWPQREAQHRLGVDEENCPAAALGKFYVKKSEDEK